jgi:hypothetical protein
MANAGVPEYLWLGTVLHESGGNPNAVGDNGTSFGLFQFHYDPLAVDPVYSGQKAASWMARAGINASQTPRQNLSAAEVAGWPGNDPKLIAKEDPQRLADMNAVIAQENQLPGGLAAQVATSASGTGDPNPKDNAAQRWVYNHTFVGPAEASTNQAVATATTGVQGTINNAVASINDTATRLGHEALVGAIIVAIIAGGFALLSSGGSDAGQPAS